MNSGDHAYFTISCGKINQYLDDLFITFGQEGYAQCEKSIRASLKKAINKGRELVAYIASQTYTAPAEKLHRETRIRKNPYMEEIVLRIYGGRGVSLMNYKPRPATPKEHPAQGVSARVKRRGSAHPWESRRGGSKSFIAPKENGGFGVFVNHGVKSVKIVPGKRPGRTRKIYKHELEMLYGPSPIQAVMRHDRQEEVRELIEDVFLSEIKQSLNEIFEKMAAK